MLCFSFDQLKETVFHPDRSHDQTIPAFRFRISGKHIKHCRRILSKTLIAGKNTTVCIQLRCRIIVVTGRQMHIAADAGFFSSDNQSDLAVCLKSYQAVDNMAACFFQHLRPDNVVLLIKSGLKLYQNRNLLAILCCLCKCRNDRRMSTDTVKRLLDRQDSRILCCLTHKINNRIKTHIWMMKEYIALTDHLKNILVILKLWYRSRRIFRALVLVKAVQSIYLHQHGKIQRSVDTVNIRIPDLKFHLKDIKKTLIHLFFCFQTNDLSPLTFLKLFLDLYQKILCLILIDRKVCITHDTVRMCTYNVIAQEKLSDVAFNDLLQKNQGTVSLLHRRDLHDSRKHRRNLNRRKFQFLCMLLIVFLRDQRTNIQCLIADQWKWSGRIHRHRCQNRIYIILKIPVNEFLLFLIQIFMLRDKMESCLFECRKNRTVKGIVLYLHQFMCLSADLFKLFL